MRYKRARRAFIIALLFSVSFAFAQEKSIHLTKTKKMKEYILLIRLPRHYGAEEATTVRAKWTALTDHWKEQGIFVTSFVFPSESYVVSSNDKVVNEEVVANGLRLISCLIIRASAFEDALQLAKKCPILEQGGTIEVREVQPRPDIKTPTAEELENKKTIRFLYENILNNKKFELLDRVISPEYTGIGNTNGKGVESFRSTVQAVMNAFPDIQWNILDMMADGDKVIVRWTWTAAHTQPFRSIPASGKTVTDNAIVVYQLQDGKVINAWMQGDRLGVLLQIGLIPPGLIPAPPDK